MFPLSMIQTIFFCVRSMLIPFKIIPCPLTLVHTQITLIIFKFLPVVSKLSSSLLDLSFSQFHSDVLNYQRRRSKVFFPKGQGLENLRKASEKSGQLDEY